MLQRKCVIVCFCTPLQVFFKCPLCFLYRGFKFQEAYVQLLLGSKMTQGGTQILPDMKFYSKNCLPTYVVSKRKTLRRWGGLKQTKLKRILFNTTVCFFCNANRPLPVMFFSVITKRILYCQNKNILTTLTNDYFSTPKCNKFN